MDGLIKPSELTITDQDGTIRTFILSNFDAVTGREIVALYPLTGIPKIGDYEANKKTMMKLMSYVAVMVNGQPLRLTTEALINNHCGDFETLMKIEMSMMEKNCSFFRNGKTYDLLEKMVEIFLTKFSETLTLLSEQLSPPEKPPSTN